MNDLTHFRDREDVMDAEDHAKDLIDLCLADITYAQIDAWSDRELFTWLAARNDTFSPRAQDLLARLDEEAKSE